MYPLTVSGIPASNTGKNLSSPASDKSGQVLLTQAKLLDHQPPIPNGTTVNYGNVRCTAINDFDVKSVDTSGTVISNRDKRNESDNTDKQSGSTTNKPSNCHKRSFTCKICGITCSNYKASVRHKKMLHDETRVRPQCHTCHRTFNRSDALALHNKKFHDTHSDCFICETCNQPFSNKFDLKQHYSTHPKPEKVPCSLCNKTFRNQSSLNRHQKCHSNIKEFNCSICNQDFRYKANLKKHMSLHSSGRTQKCEICNESFVGKIKLAHHKIISHGDGKFYSCQICHKKLASRKSLLTHNGKYHNSAQGATTSTKTNECKDSSMQVNTDGERKENNTCSKAGKRKPCDKFEEETCNEFEEETCNEFEEETCDELEEETCDELEEETCDELEEETCDELEEETCDELEEETHSKLDEAGNVYREPEEEGIRNELERGSSYSEHMKKIPENSDGHHHFPGKMTTAWTKSWFLDVAHNVSTKPIDSSK